MAANAKQVVQYQWKQRVTVIRKGTPAEPLIDQIRFNSDGTMQRTIISAPRENSTGIRGRVAAGVRENVKEIMQLVSEYNKPQQIVNALERAKMSSAAAGGSLQLQTSSVLQQGDSMTMLVSPASNLLTHVEVQTTYDGGAMTIAEDYAPLPAGPNVMKAMDVSVPHKGLVIKVESFDFQRQGA